VRSPPPNQFDNSNILPSQNKVEQLVDDLIDMDKTSDGHIIPDDNSTASKNKLMLDMLEEKKLPSRDLSRRSIKFYCK